MLVTANPAMNRVRRPVTRELRIISTGGEAVAGSAHSEDQSWPLGSLLELGPQVPDVDVDPARVAIGAVAPDRPQQLLPAEVLPRPRQERVQQLELRERELDRLATDLHRAPRAVHRHLADAEDLRVGAPAAGAAQDGADAASELRAAGR